MTCKNCGAQLGAEDKFCAVCGVSTAEETKPNFCMHCGGRLNGSDRFCAFCGCPVGETDSAAGTDSNISASRLYYRPRSNGLDLRTAVSVTLVLICVGIFLAGTLLGWWHL